MAGHGSDPPGVQAQREARRRARVEAGGDADDTEEEDEEEGGARTTTQTLGVQGTCAASGVGHPEKKTL